MRGHWLLPLGIALVIVIILGAIMIAVQQTVQSCSQVNWCRLSEMNAGAAITVTIGAFLASGVNLFYRVPKYNQQERILHELAIMRTSGVTLRNQRPEEVFSAEKIEGWFMVWNAEIEMWHTKLYKEAYKFSPVEAERLRTLDTMPEVNLEVLWTRSNFEPFSISARHSSVLIRCLKRDSDLRHRPSFSS